MPGRIQVGMSIAASAVVVGPVWRAKTTKLVDKLLQKENKS